MAEKKRVQKSLPFEGGKLPAQNIDAEEAILGAIMVEKDAFEAVESILRAEMFYKDSHSMIFKAICSLKAANKPIDLLTVTDQLKTDSNLEAIGGAYAVTLLTNKVASATNIATHAMMVAECFMKREVVRICQEYINDAFSDESDPFDIIENLKTDIATLESGIGEENTESFASAIDSEIKEKKEQIKKGITFNGIKTGNAELDEKIGGFERGCLHILGARSGGGKSARALMFAKKAAEQGYFVAIFSIEMTQRNYIRRFVVESSSVLLTKYRNNNLDDCDLRAIDFAASQLKKLPIHIDDSPMCTPNKIRKVSNRLKKSKGRKVDFIIVDYVQLMKSDEKQGSRELEISNISNELKSISKELDIPILALAQLNKDATREGGAQRPKTSHLRESAALEYNSDLVMFIYRPEVYFPWGDHPDEDYSKDRISETEYNMISELLIGKARDGATNLKIIENFMGGYQRFSPKNEVQSEDPFGVPENSDLTPF